MKYLLDTNIISECYKPKPYPSVMEWLGRQNAASVFLSAITIGEIRRGIEKKRIDTHQAHAANTPLQALQHIESHYKGRIWPFDQMAAHIWGTVTLGYKDKILDTQIASIALANNATVVTRDKDFIDLASKIRPFGLELPLINPFEMH